MIAAMCHTAPTHKVFTRVRYQQQRARFYHHVAALSGGRAQMSFLPDLRSKGVRAAGGFFIPGGFA